jgi:hypothetical protein
MKKKLSVKIVGILIMVMIVIMAVFSIYFIRTRSANMEEELLSKGRIEALTGAKMMERILQEALDSGRFRPEHIFDERYVPIPGTDPQKYHTQYDGYLDNVIQALEDEFLKDDQVVFAVLVDRNGYLPTHNSKYSLPLTGDKEKDKVGNRSKRLFNDPVGLAAAKNQQELLNDAGDAAHLQPDHLLGGELAYPPAAPAHRCGAADRRRQPGRGSKGGE